MNEWVLEYDVRLYKIHRHQSIVLVGVSTTRKKKNRRRRETCTNGEEVEKEEDKQGGIFHIEMNVVSSSVRGPFH